MPTHQVALETQFTKEDIRRVTGSPQGQHIQQQDPKEYQFQQLYQHGLEHILYGGAQASAAARSLAALIAMGKQCYGCCWQIAV